jgi:hypothetical protein
MLAKRDLHAAAYEACVPKCLQLSGSSALDLQLSLNFKFRKLQIWARLFYEHIESSLFGGRVVPLWYVRVRVYVLVCYSLCLCI